MEFVSLPLAQYNTITISFISKINKKTPQILRWKQICRGSIIRKLSVVYMASVGNNHMQCLTGLEHLIFVISIALYKHCNRNDVTYNTVLNNEVNEAFYHWYRILKKGFIIFDVTMWVLFLYMFWHITNSPFPCIGTFLYFGKGSMWDLLFCLFLLHFIYFSLFYFIGNTISHPLDYF